MSDWMFMDGWFFFVFGALPVGGAPTIHHSYFNDLLDVSSNLVVSEIMFRPAQPSTEEESAGFTDRDDFEFIELHNLSDEPLTLFDSQFTDGIVFEFADATSASLPAGSHGVVVKDLEAFRVRYGDGPTVLGSYEGRLSNDGERIALQDGSGTELIAITYNDAWYREADGAGMSLLLNGSAVPSDWNVAETWSPSEAPNGSPGSGSGSATSPVPMPAPRLDLPLSITSVDGEATVTLGSDGENEFRLEVTENLRDWRPLRTSKDKSLTDAATPYQPTRFYRAAEVTGESDVISGDHLITNDGDLVIHPVNHASFVMQWNGMMIYNDPVGGAALYSDFLKPHLILVSHQHGDHFDSGTLNAVKGDNTVIITGAGVFGSLSTSLKGITTTLANGESTEVLGVTIEAIPAYNGRHPKDRDNGYVLTIGGKRLYMSGDTEDIPEMRALENIDVAFLSMNLPFTMSIDQAADAVREFRPRVVYPYHFRNQNGTFSDLEKFKELVGREGSVEVRIRDWY
ncbi:MAG: L-ascorbate metabolism protein UlaG (beta-lactamase superfamily) [Verrucomicrobiales bacterium]